MFNYNSFLLHCLVGLIHIVIIVSTLDTESILHGQTVEQLLHPHQAGIIGKANGSNEEFLMGSGVIIHDFFILSVAHILFKSHEQLKDLRFYAIVGTKYVKNTNSILRRDVIKIYTHLYNFETMVYDVAVLKLVTRVGLDQNWYLNTVVIPSPEDYFLGLNGEVTGYGFHEITVEISLNGTRRITGGNIDFLLRVGNATVTHLSRCASTRENVNNWSHLCGLMLPNHEGQSTGICVGDSGSPLIINKKVVGLASRSTEFCDDTVEGTLYTKLSSFQHFIRVILRGSYLSEMRIYDNKIHSLHPVH